MNWTSTPTTEQKKPLNSLGNVVAEFIDTGHELWEGRFNCPDCGNEWRALVSLYKAKGQVLCPQCNVTHEVDLLQSEDGA